MSRKACLKLSVSALLLFPFAVNAQVIISEIMYDLDGSDSDREWIEIFNESSSAVDLSGWKFFEGTSNHGLVLSQGSESLVSGGYVVIVDDVPTFLIDRPSYSGTIFDSSFSLNNTGETLILRDSELVDIDSVTYNKEWGAAGDGNSLTRDSAGVFSALAPTPGSGNLSTEGSSSSEPSESSGTTSSSPPVSSAPTFEPKIFAHAGVDREVTVGADTKFSGDALGIAGDELINARYLWNFGDGMTREGESVLHNFKYPGEYVVVLNVASGQYSASDKIVVKALPANLEILRGSDGSIILKNKENREIDLSWWYLRSGNPPAGGTFQLPENTYMLPNKEVVFSSSVTELSEIAPLSLLYPNTSTAVSEGEVIAENQVVKTVVKEVAAPKPKPGKLAIVPQARVVEEVFEDEPEIEVDSLAASAVVATEQGGSLYKWLLALVGLMGLGIGSALYIQKKGRNEFTIID